MYTCEWGKGDDGHRLLPRLHQLHPHVSVTRIPGSHHGSVKVKEGDPQLHAPFFFHSWPRCTWRGGGTLDGSRCSYHQATISPLAQGSLANAVPQTCINMVFKSKSQRSPGSARIKTHRPCLDRTCSRPEGRRPEIKW